MANRSEQFCTDTAWSARLHKPGAIGWSLVEAGTSNHVWAERYDRDLADIFAVQDELTEALTTALAPAIADAELRRAMRKPPGSLDAWAAYQRGRGI